MALTKDQTAGVTILSLVFISDIVLNCYLLEIGAFGWFGAIFMAIIVGVFLISLIFFFLANRHFKEITTHHNNKIVGWTCMFVFVALNIAANYIGIEELIRIKHW
jgi:Kef-type K+ transport system membrane component KefB